MLFIKSRRMRPGSDIVFRGGWNDCHVLCSDFRERPQVRNERSTVYAEPLLAWSYSTSFPIGIAALIYLRVHFGYDWPFPVTVGLGLLCIGLILLLADVFLPNVTYGYSQVLRRQSIYSSLWTSLIGVWIYWRLGGDFGLVILIAVALPLWPLSHREVLRLKGH